MKIVEDTVWSRALDCTPEERAFLTEYLSFEETRYIKAGGRTKRVAPKVHQLFSAVTGALPAGMTRQVVRAAKEEGFDVQLGDARTPPYDLSSIRNALTTHKKMLDAAHRLGGMIALQDMAAQIPGLSNVLAVTPAGWLRPYQFAAVERVMQHSRGILSMPTGSGKTEVAIALATCIPVDWLFLVHRKGLMEQAAARYELRTGEVAGRVGEGKWDEQQFTVATFQTIARAFTGKDSVKRARAVQLLARCRGVIIDECHTLPANSFWPIAMKTINAYWRIGMSGTPLDRDDRKSLMAIAATGPIIYHLKARTLIDMGVLAEPTFHMLACEQDSELPTWQGVYGECIVRSAKRNRILTKCAVAAEKPCLLFVKEVKHGRELTARLGKEGLVADFAHGKHSVEWRQNMINSLERGQLDVLVCTVIFQEGTDIPCLASVVIGSGGKSVIAALQRIGRGMRSDGGKKMTFEVYDVADTGNKWLERHAKRRMSAYRSAGFDVS